MDYQIIIIIGLPGSGKTQLSKTFNRKIYDDFIQTWYNGQVEISLRNEEKICLNDPRLCIPSIFDRYIKRIKDITDDIILILFENNPEACLKNIQSRDNVILYENNIIKYSQYYNLDYYKAYDHIIVPVYNPDV